MHIKKVDISLTQQNEITKRIFNLYNMKNLKLKANKNNINLTLTVYKNSFHLSYESSILVSGWIDNSKFGIDSFSKELFFFKDEIIIFLNKNIK